jgi:hypothetical protein
LQRFRPHRSKLVSSTLEYSPLQPEPRISCESFATGAYRICGVATTTRSFGTALTCEFRIAAKCKPTVTPINPVIAIYRIFGVAMTMCVSKGAVMCKPGTATPIIRAITPIKPRETARAAATEPPIEGPAEDKSFSRREVIYEKLQPPDDWHCVDRRVCIPVSRTRAGPADREGVRIALEV